MIEVGVHEAGRNLSKLLRQVAKGYRVTITRRGIPVATLVPVTRDRARPAKEIIPALLAFREGWRLGRRSLRSMIAGGRR